jgi:glucan phosphoethanolaminetransferase (alkaline phosphatase superfamily)
MSKRSAGTPQLAKYYYYTFNVTAINQTLDIYSDDNVEHVLTIPVTFVCRFFCLKSLCCRAN